MTDFATNRPDPRLREDFEHASPFTQFEYVPITFLAADTDLDIRHHLTPPTPEQVDYQLVRTDRATTLYHDTSGTRRPWGKGFMTLRSSTANAVTTILVTVRRT